MTRIEDIWNRLGNRGAAESGGEQSVGTRIANRALLLLLLLASQLMLSQSALAQTRGGAITLRYGSISPIIALLAGILILIMPRLLNYIVAIYLILIGLVGLFGV